SHTLQNRERLHAFAIKHQLQVRAGWITGVDKVEADRASRGLQGHPSQPENIQDWTGPLKIDLFASPQNAQLPKFVTLKAHNNSSLFRRPISPFPEEGGYANPPFILIPRVLRKVRTEKVKRLI